MDPVIIRGNMNSSNITLATEADIPALCDLLSILFSQEAEFKPDQQAQSKGIRMIIGNPEVGAVLVLRDDSKVLGMVILL